MSSTLFEDDLFAGLGTTPAPTPKDYTLRQTAKTLTGGLLDQVVLLNLKIGCLGTSRKADVDLIDTDADKDLLRLSKKILDCDEMQAIRQHHSRIRSFVKSVMLPQSDQFRPGMYLLPLALAERTENFLFGARKELSMRIDDLLDVYAEKIAEDREKLKDQFNIDDYPSKQKVIAAFVLQYEYVALSTPDGLKSVSIDLYKRETDKLQARIEAAADESRYLIMQQAKELAKAIADRLTPGEDGKSKTFLAGPLKAWEDFLSTFSAKNITGDEELSALMADVQGKLKGKSPKSVKSQSDEVKGYFEKVTKQLDTMITDKPTRIIKFED